MPPSRRRWAVTILTIPSRDKYLRQLLRSLAETDVPALAEIVVVYNAKPEEPPFEVEARIRKHVPELPVAVHVNSQDTSIAGGRNFQLNVCKAPLVCFLDDDLTLHGDVFPLLEDTLRETPFGIVGIPSFDGDSDRRFKPRESTPHVDRVPLRFMQVQGMLAAGYRDLFEELGGFNPRRRFWGEWTEMNLRMWRAGFPTGYRMDGGFLRHWIEAPESPTRSMTGREAHVLWGLICTALEYDAVDVNQATETFWQLVEDRYLAYSFGDKLSPTQLLRTTLDLMPRLSSEWASIMQFREVVREHPFQFKPFHPLTPAEVDQVLQHAAGAVRPYREQVWPRRLVPAAVSGKASKARGVLSRVVSRLLGGR